MDHFGTNVFSLAKIQNFLRSIAKFPLKTEDIFGRPHITNPRSWSPLHYAASMGLSDVCQSMIEDNFNFDIFGNTNLNLETLEGETPLHLAALFGHVDVCKVLLNISEDVNPKTIENWTPFHYAVKKGQLSVCELFIHKNVDINSTNSDGQTVVHIAAANGYLDVCVLIMDHIEEINPKDKYGRTPFDYARENKNNDILILIMSYTYQNGYGWTPLHMAAQMGNFEEFQTLVESSKDKNPKDSTGMTPMHLAALEGHIDVWRSLVNYVDDKNPKDDIGMTPFHIAAEEGNFELVTAMLQVVSDKNPKEDLGGVTPMTFAAKYSDYSNNHLITFNKISDSILEIRPNTFEDIINIAVATSLAKNDAPICFGRYSKKKFSNIRAQRSNPARFLDLPTALLREILEFEDVLNKGYTILGSRLAPANEDSLTNTRRCYQLMNDLYRFQNLK